MSFTRLEADLDQSRRRRFEQQSNRLSLSAFLLLCLIALGYGVFNIYTDWSYDQLLFVALATVFGLMAGLCWRNVRGTNPPTQEK